MANDKQNNHKYFTDLAYKLSLLTNNQRVNSQIVTHYRASLIEKINNIKSVELTQERTDDTPIEIVCRFERVYVPNYASLRTAHLSTINKPIWYK